MTPSVVLKRIRRLLALGLSQSILLTSVFAAAGQNNVRVDKPQVPILWRPYVGPYVPPIDLTNSDRLSRLIRGGNLYLTVQDAIALAVENNLDLEVDRYNPLLSEWALERSEAGGAARGVNTISNNNVTVTAGQGVQGAQNTLGNTGAAGGTNVGGSGGAIVTQIGPVAPNFDPIFQNTTNFGHQSRPLPSVRLSFVSTLIDDRRNYNNSISQGLPTGGTATLLFSDSYLNENAPTTVLNPSSSAVMALSLSHNLLSGFGIAVNSRQINVAKQNLKVSDLTFRSNLISTVSNLLGLYWGLVSDLEDERAKQNAVDLARQLYNDNKKQVQIGTMAPLDITQAESQVASSQRDLIFSQIAAQQQEVNLKNAIDRNGIGDPVLANVHIVPLDHIDVPQTLDLPPLHTLVQQASGVRTDIAADKINFANAKTAAIGTANGVLPALQVFATASAQGLSGAARPFTISTPLQGVRRLAPDAYFVGGFGNAAGQIFRRNFPSQQLRLSYRENIHNGQAQADYGIEQLQLRQNELRNQKDLNQVTVDVSNQMIALQQAQTRYQATVKSRILEEQLVSAEQKKYKLGTSTTYAVIQVERDLATARSNEVAATAQFANAKIGLERVLGTTLEAYNIGLKEAMDGRVARSSALPDQLPRQ
jgi:outer membrane protein